MKKLVLATLAVVLFGGVAFAQDCISRAVEQTNWDESQNGCLSSEEYTASVCDYYNECMSNM